MLHQRFNTISPSFGFIVLFHTIPTLLTHIIRNLHEMQHRAKNNFTALTNNCIPVFRKGVGVRVHFKIYNSIRAKVLENDMGTSGQM